MALPVREDAAREIARYESALSGLEETLFPSVASGDPEAAEALRGLVESVAVSRDPSRGGGIEVLIKGRLNALLGEDVYPVGGREV